MSDLVLILLINCINHLIKDELFVKTNRSSHNFPATSLILNKIGHGTPIVRVDSCLHIIWHWFGSLNLILCEAIWRHNSVLWARLYQIWFPQLSTFPKTIAVSELYTVSPHDIPSCHTAAKSAYLQTMSINSDTRRTSLRHRDTILCAHKLNIPWQRFGTFQLSLTIPEHSLGVITLLRPSPIKNLPASTVLEVQFASYT